MVLHGLRGLRGMISLYDLHPVTLDGVGGWHGRTRLTIHLQLLSGGLDVVTQAIIFLLFLSGKSLLVLGACSCDTPMCAATRLIAYP